MLTSNTGTVYSVDNGNDIPKMVMITPKMMQAVVGFTNLDNNEVKNIKFIVTFTTKA